MPGFEVVSASPLEGFALIEWREGREELIYQNSHENSPLVPPWAGRRGRHGGGGVPRHHSWPFSQNLALDPASLPTAEVLGRVERAGGVFMPPHPNPRAVGVWRGVFSSGSRWEGRVVLSSDEFLQAPPEPVLVGAW